ncbi:Amino-acid carrier protein AlsT [compost metagenome]
MGSAPNIAAVATPNPHHPSSQGFVQALGVFIDTLLICTATAIMILLSGVVPGPDMTGTPLTQAAMNEHIGWAGQYFIAIAIFFFAFTSIIGNYTYAENAMVYLKLNTRLGLTVLRTAALLMVVWGAYESVTTVFDAADAAMGLMATINLVAICLLSGVVVKLTRDYFAQKAVGTPEFNAKDYPELAGKIDAEIWGAANGSEQPLDALKER